MSDNQLEEIIEKLIAENTMGDQVYLNGSSHPGSSSKPFTLDMLAEALKKIKALPKNEDWLLVDPKGRVYSGKSRVLLNVLIRDYELRNLNNSSLKFLEQEQENRNE